MFHSHMNSFSSTAKESIIKSASTNEESSSAENYDFIPALQKWPGYKIKKFLLFVAYNAPFLRYSIINGKRKVSNFGRIFMSYINESDKSNPHIAAITSRYYSIMPRIGDINNFCQNKNKDKKSDDIANKKSTTIYSKVDKNCFLKKRKPFASFNLESQSSTDFMPKKHMKVPLENANNSKKFTFAKSFNKSSKASEHIRNDLHIKIDGRSMKKVNENFLQDTNVIVRFKINEEA